MRAYRYGFNGKERDNAAGSDDYDFGARIYDPRIGRWLSVDREPKAYWSPYSGMANNPIITIDPDGKNEIVVVDQATRTITIYRPVLYNASQNDILQRIGHQTPAELEAAAQKQWEKPENQKVMVDIGGGKQQEYTVAFKTDLIVAKDNEEFGKIQKEFNDKGLAYSELNIVTKQPQSSYQEHGLVGVLTLDVTAAAPTSPVSTQDKVVNAFSHEEGHGSGLSHSLAPTQDAINPINKTHFLEPISGQAGISSYDPNPSVQKWEVQAIANSISKVIANDNNTDKSPRTYNLISHEQSGIRNDALNSLQRVKSKTAVKYVSDCIKTRDDRIANQKNN